MKEIMLSRKPLAGTALLLAALWLLLAAAPASAATTMLWRAEKDGRSFYFFGSIHVGVETMYPLPRVVDDAFAASDLLAVELDAGQVDPAEMADLMLGKGVASDPAQGLQQTLDADTWRLLEQRAGELGVPVEIFKPQRPWLATMTLTLLAAQRAGFSEEFGIDLHFLRRAAAVQKPIVELETLASQIGVFLSLDDAEQRALLRRTLDELGDAHSYFHEMLALWQSGDGEALHEMINEPMSGPDLQRLYQLLLTERNRNMADAIAALLEQGSTPFVVVGAGHLVGPDSLVALFSERGYTLTQY